MSRRSLILSVLCVALPAWADEPLPRMSFVDVSVPSQRAGVALVPAGGNEAHEEFVVEKTTPGQCTFQIASVDDPGFTMPVYAVTGELRYDRVEGDAYLMTWSCFPEGKYFSKGLRDSGPARKIGGSSGWRRFVLPFFCNVEKKPDYARPHRVELSLVMAGTGTVAIRNLKLEQFAPGEDPLAITGQWWSGATAGWIGGIGGAFIGCLGGLIGTLVGLGRARQLVVALAMLLTGIGVVSLVGGIFALVLGQSYAVYYPLLLAGLLCTILPLTQLGTIRRRYEELELRRMNAVDAA